MAVRAGERRPSISIEQRLFAGRRISGTRSCDFSNGLARRAARAHRRRFHAGSVIASEGGDPPPPLDGPAGRGPERLVLPFLPPRVRRALPAPRDHQPERSRTLLHRSSCRTAPPAPSSARCARESSGPTRRALCPRSHGRDGPVPRRSLSRSVRRPDARVRLVRHLFQPTALAHAVSAFVYHPSAADRPRSRPMPNGFSDAPRVEHSPAV
jgi:hypothetical protein